MNCQKCGKEKIENNKMYSFKEVYEKYCICNLAFKKVVSLPKNTADQITSEDDLLSIMKHIGNLIGD